MISLADMNILHELVGEVLPVCGAIPVPVPLVTAGRFDYCFSTSTVCLLDGYRLSNLTSINATSYFPHSVIPLRSIDWRRRGIYNKDKDIEIVRLIASIKPLVPPAA